MDGADGVADKGARMAGSKRPAGDSLEAVVAVGQSPDVRPQVVALACQCRRVQPVRCMGPRTRRGAAAGEGGMVRGGLGRCTAPRAQMLGSRPGAQDHARRDAGCRRAAAYRGRGGQRGGRPADRGPLQQSRGQPAQAHDGEPAADCHTVRRVAFIPTPARTSSFLLDRAALAQRPLILWPPMQGGVPEHGEKGRGARGDGRDGRGRAQQDDDGHAGPRGAGGRCVSAGPGACGRLSLPLAVACARRHHQV